MVVLLVFLLIIAITHFTFHFKYSTKLKLNLKYSIIGFVSNFLDFFGIGSYVQQTYFLDNEKKYKGKEYLFPGTLNIANYVPIIVEAFIIINISEVNWLTLILLPSAAFIGSFIGSRFVSFKNNNLVKVVLSISLILSAVLIYIELITLNSTDNINQTLNGFNNNYSTLFFAAFIYLILGFLGSFGLGIYAPGFAFLGLFNINYTAALSINILSAIFVSSANSITFLRKKEFISDISMSITIFGILGVLFAGFILTIPIISSNFDIIIIFLKLFIATISLYSGFKILYTLFREIRLNKKN